jgi:hypothetical protein
LAQTAELTGLFAPCWLPVPHSGLKMTLCGEGFQGTPINQIDSSP